MARSKNLIQNQDIEIILIDNGSTDNTSYYIDLEVEKNKNVKKLKINKNKGFGFGVYQGLQEAKTDIVGYTHADLQCDPEDFIQSLKLIEKNNLHKKEFLIKGRRRNRKVIDKIFTTCMSIFESFLFGVKIFDINAQPNIFSKKLLNKINFYPNNFLFDLCIYLTCTKYNFKIIRFDVDFKKRNEGTGNNDKFLDKIFNSYSMIIESIKFRKNF